MNSVIVTLSDVSLNNGRTDLITSLRKLGLTVQELTALPKLLVVKGTTVATFPLKNHPAIITLEDDKPDTFKVEETITIDALPVSGAWPKLRHISRDNPWGRMTSGKLPYSGQFSSHRTGVGVDIYLVDTGIRDTHVEFEGRANNLDGWEPIHFHGTFCASCAVGVSIGIATGALVWMAAGLRNADNTGSTLDLLTAIDACLSHYNARVDTNRPAVLSMSFSGTSASYTTAINACIDAGIVCLAAAANDVAWLDDVNKYPAEDDGVICVGGINMDDGPYFINGSGTNYGMQVDILAGAQHCRGADFVDDSAYRTGSGTSYATSYVAGIIACMLQDYERLQSRTQVLEVGEYLYRQATFGRYKPDIRQEPLTPAIAYLDPGVAYPSIPSLVVRSM